MNSADFGIVEAEQKIRKFSPEFQLKSLRLIGKGTESVAFLANEEWIFRFPKISPQKTIETEREIRVLQKLSNGLAVNVPNFQYVAREKENVIYAGYKRLQGEPLEKELFYALDQAKQERALQDLAQFLQKLHSLPTNDLGVHEELYKGAYNQKQKTLLDEARHLLSQKECAKIEAIIKDYEMHFAKNSKTSLLHADLKPEHILYDPETAHITGIIDWGDVCIGDPDYDFAPLQLFFDKSLVKRLLNYFPLDQEHTLKKIQFFITIRWLQDLVLFDKSCDKEFVNLCQRKIREQVLEK